MDVLRVDLSGASARVYLDKPTNLEGVKQNEKRI